MTKEEAREKALDLCRSRHIAPGERTTVYESMVRTTPFWKALFSKSRRIKTWVVLTGMEQKGGNTVFQFNAETGELIDEHLISR